MRFRARKFWCVAGFVVFVSCALAVALLAHDKTVWNYDGGIELITDGSIPDGPCFRIKGNVTAPEFFDHLKRIDSDSGTLFRRGEETVSQFPDELVLSFAVFDLHAQTCPPPPEGDAPKYLTRAMMSTLDLYLYWKRGVELRPIRGVEKKYFSVDPIIPYAAAKAYGLPEKFQWSYQYLVPSKGVPLTESLVLVLRTPDGHIAARVAARL